MKTRIRRFAIYSVILTSMLFICFTLLDLFEGTARERIIKNVILSVTTGVMTSASLTLWLKPENQNRK